VAIRTSKNIVFNAAWMTSLVGTIGADTITQNGLDDSTLHLFKGELIPTTGTDSTTYDAAECDYSGYGAATVTSMANIIPSVNQRALYKSVTFLLAAFGFEEGNTITGYWLEDDLGAVVLGERFTVPVTFDTPGQYLDLNLLIPFNLLITLPDQSV